MRPRSKRAAGVTLIELLVVVVIIAGILTLVAPSFRQVIEMQRLRGVHDQLVTDLQLARTEAARLGVPVHVAVYAASDAQQGCYILFTDTNYAYGFSPACDCREPAGRRCTSPNTSELRIVTIPATAGGLKFGTAGQINRVGFDPATGARLTSKVDAGEFVINQFGVETYYDDSRKLRTTIEYSGRPTTCAPAGSKVRVPSC